MLVSHRHRFIYTKTMKTAGTSVEIFFEDAALPLDREIPRGHAIEEIESLSGVVGFRGAYAPNPKWYNHMPARDIRAKVGMNIWADYFKFCVIRNPFEKAVSFWWHLIHGREAECMASADFSVVRASFAEWIERHIDHLVDRAVYMVDDQIVMDDFIRYETLLVDLERMCGRVGVEYKPEKLGAYKAEFRRRSERFEAYYDEQAARIVRNAFGFELEYFGYDLSAQ